MKRNLSGGYMIRMIFIVMVLIILAGCSTDVGRVIYVDVSAQAGRTGASWEKAYKSLQDALDEAKAGDEIRVAAGIYKPSAIVGGKEDRKKSFQLKKGVALYGGFRGRETARDQRYWRFNKTVLSGDINGDDVGFKNNDENCFHVVTGNGTDETAVLDGFVITAGNANADVWPDDGGGGMSATTKVMPC